MTAIGPLQSGMRRAVVFLKQHVMPAALCFAAAWLLMHGSLLRRVETVTLDERTKLRSHFDATSPSDELLFVSIDSVSLRELGRWPWDRDVHGDLLALLARVRPAVVAFDVLFAESTPKDEPFARAIPKNRAVTLGAMTAEADDGLSAAEARAAGARLEPLTHVFGDVNGVPKSPAMVPPAGQLGAEATIGFVDTPPDLDGVRRSVPLVVRVGDDLYPSLSLRILMDYWGAKASDVTVRLGDAILLEAPLGRRRIPIGETGTYTVNYRHNADAVQQRGYSTLLTQLHRRFVEHQPVAANGVTGRIVLIGQVAEGLSDFGPTPLDPLTPLTMVHANVLENVLREDYVRPVPRWTPWCVLFALGVFTSWRFAIRTPWEQALLSLGIPAAFAAMAVLAWIDGSWEVPLVGPLLGFGSLQTLLLGRRMLTELRAKEQIRGMFGTYVSPEVVKRLIASGRKPELGGHTEEITAYFSDIEGFSSFSEVLPPEQLVELMNEYLTACTDIVQEEGGALDKYVGDAVIAMFGTPVELPDHAHRACRAALRVQRRLGELRAKWSEEARWPQLVCGMRTRIGLNTGPCVVGNMGSRTRFNYTMMGDNVNLAARMESGAKQWGVLTMCAEPTSAACEKHAPGSIVFRPLGRIQVKGRASAVPIFELVGFAAETTPATRECVQIFTEGLNAYYRREWDEATRFFSRSLECEPVGRDQPAGSKANPSLVYLELVAQLRANPPPPGWDGVYAMRQK
jgi:adenylate cyclase